MIVGKEEEEEEAWWCGAPWVFSCTLGQTNDLNKELWTNAPPPAPPHTPLPRQYITHWGRYGSLSNTDGHRSWQGQNERDHGSPQHLERHVGDLGNILADEIGTAHVDILDPLITLEGPTSVIGLAIVVDEREDDLGTGGHPSSLTTGNAGDRVACGVIGKGRY
ncbi:superoxide dismutase [Cu-Zn]-like [Eriocheir sinensis]|uniref:superoxide dismutase [Cu-Zn]-like n=1 Tax=Eriocheir sinensis TaxID=95602 RepID=UPI0021C7600A|nr:superoxide dismutase [Cu-Zn]-like [Eriocheir sinensis]